MQSPTAEASGSNPPLFAGNPSPPAAKIGRPPQWTESRSRKLARLYMYTTLPIEKIIKVLEDGGFRPGRNSAQKTLHNMLGHDPRYLRPEGNDEMNERIGGLTKSNSRRRSNGQRPGKLNTQVGGLSPSTIQTPNSQLWPDVPSHSYPNSAVSERDIKDEAMSFGGHPEPWRHFGYDSPSPVPGGHQAQPFSPSGHGSVGPWPDGSVAYGTPPTSAVEAGPIFSSGHFIPNRLNQSNTMFSNSTTASTASIRNLKQRMSLTSNKYAKQVSFLLRKLTIGQDADANESQNNNSLTPNALHLGHDEEMYTAENTADAVHALPGDFFAAFNACEFYPASWQGITTSISQVEGFWVQAPTGSISETALQILEQPSAEKLSMRDTFGNTPLHLFAARLPDYPKLIQLVTFCGEQQLCSKNTAGQTLLHVLAPWWFYHIDDPSSPLLQLVGHLRTICPSIFSLCDVYGRTFFHRLQAIATDAQAVSRIMLSFERAHLPRRDAFGHSPAEDLAMPSAAAKHSQMLSPLPEEILNSPTGNSSPTAVVDMFAQHHAGLLRIIASAHEDPTVEDKCGRNGLHCLAEVIIDTPEALTERCNSLAARRPLKRKYDRKDRPDGDNGSETTLGRRLQLVQGLLFDNPGMDVNHYDLNGSTVLMAFVSQITDNDEDRHKNLVAILNRLIDGGARVEARNRKGETALLLAARLGRKTALKALLERGANVHARDVDGRGVLEVIDETCSRAGDDVALYGRLEACRVLLTGRYKEEWGVTVLQTPSVIDEWRMRPAAKAGIKQEPGL